MERELKFRAWDGKNMILFSDMTIGIERRYNKPYVFFNTDTFGGEVRLGKHEVMQFTGLHDKNGKEIYEGDILSNYRGSIYTVDDMIDFHFYVADNPGWFSISEVIGNRFENPELIK